MVSQMELQDIFCALPADAYQNLCKFAMHAAVKYANKLFRTSHSQLDGNPVVARKCHVDQLESVKNGFTLLALKSFSVQAHVNVRVDSECSGRGVFGSEKT